MEIILFSEVSQDKNHVSPNVESRKKMIQMNLFTKQIQTHRRRTQIYGYQGEG